MHLYYSFWHKIKYCEDNANDTMFSIFTNCNWMSTTCRYRNIRIRIISILPYFLDDNSEAGRAWDARAGATVCDSSVIVRLYFRWGPQSQCSQVPGGLGGQVTRLVQNAMYLWCHTMDILRKCLKEVRVVSLCLPRVEEVDSWYNW